ncbi:MAG: UDP-N-acetylglucosamine 2-epimerase (non-hydrolyzing) [Candidatus Marinimicrobia bacterium]|jgi:UDP-N-acetyl-L-fucosamine synthase|nr:UDP-N-acetylglucosamine 2-epimerase (non-hydrolyzing) [Candidatus Neomarinimicrobiota bacterium]
MNKKIKVMTIVGTRPEIIRLSRVLSKLDEYTGHTLVHTGQNYDYELNEIFFKELDIKKPDYFLNAAGENAAATIGNIISKIDPILEEVNPDAILVLGDTNSCLSVIPAKRRHIPIFHMEAGNRCFDQRVPEETNRKIVDHISDINLTYSDIAREYLLREGLPPDQIVKTGSPMFEVLQHFKGGIESSSILDQLHLEKNGFFLVSVHREENIEPSSQFNNFVNILNELPNQYDKDIIVSTHPRTRRRIENEDVTFNDSVRLLKPLGFIDYINLQKNAFIVLSDSGTISEESSILSFPALNLREAHERPEAMEEASVIMTGLDYTRVLQGVELLIKQEYSNDCVIKLVNDYSMPNVSDKVVRIILSYTDYINRKIWRKNI